jgi:glycosyltransferase involved in cell wall biosynthesis
MNRISVILPIYNGEAYLLKQLHSICTQLLIEDELIIIDDLGHDSSMELVINTLDLYPNLNIKIIKNSSNIGVVKSIERGVLESSSPIVTFADQDDIWSLNKMDVIRKEFNLLNDDLVLFDGYMINENDKLLTVNPISADIDFNKSIFKNFIKNCFLGCNMVVKKSTIQEFLPFPPNTPMHDIYLGMSMLLHRKNVRFCFDKLLYFRRHNFNQTPKKTSLLRKIIFRGQLFLSIFNV